MISAAAATTATRELQMGTDAELFDRDHISCKVCGFEINNWRHNYLLCNFQSYVLVYSLLINLNGRSLEVWHASRLQKGGRCFTLEGVV